MHSAGLELTKLTYTKLEDNLIRHRGDRALLLLLWGYAINRDINSGRRGLFGPKRAAGYCSDRPGKKNEKF